jgi:transcriptional regulator with XRE-family HTH domain
VSRTVVWGLAGAPGLSMSVVEGIEQGRRRNPRLSTLLALAGALGVGLDALTGGLPAAKKPKP